MKSYTEKALEDILDVLVDISDSLAAIAGAANRPASVVELDDSTIDMLSALHSDGGIQLPKPEVKTFGDVTVLKGDEEGLA